MTSRERIHLALAHQEADHVAIHDVVWGTTLERWRREGLPQTASPHGHFGYEISNCGCDATLQLPVETIEETDEYTVTTTKDGGVRRNWKGKTSTPELVDFTITTRALWEQHKPRMAMNESRVDWERQLAANKAHGEAGLFRTMNFAPGFTKVCNTVGPERLLIAMAEEPEWATDMFMSVSEVCVACAEAMMSRGFEFDAGWIFDDLGFKHRSFMSPAMYREQLWPAHKLICDCFKSRGLKMFLHSCGYVMNLIPDLIDAGFDVIQPLEVKAGNDLLALKREYGDRLTFMGGIDVRAMADPDPEVIEREIASKVPVAMQAGGYIYHSDHSVPDNVSFQQYTRVIQLVQKYGRYK